MFAGKKSEYQLLKALMISLNREGEMQHAYS